jgi:hypothetical protein
MFAPVATGWGDIGRVHSVPTRRDRGQEMARPEGSESGTL